MRFYAFCVLLFSGLVLPALTLCAQTSASSNQAAVPVIAGLPGPLVWQHPPAQWKIDDGKTLSITAGKQTDWYLSAMDEAPRDNSARLLFKPAEDFELSAKVNVDFQSQWDAGVLVLYVNDTLWAKFCFEMSIEKRPTIVSVVTRGLSDDSNSIPIDGSSVYLKVNKVGHAIYFFSSEDGQHWSVIRIFSLGEKPDLRIGFSSQSPVGERCTTTFSEIKYLPKKVSPWSGK
jgi:regulation of enolase protein 1 (concanavalin A-like superfamily)